MKKIETEHYIFHYGADTKAEQDIEKISAYQEMFYAQNVLLWICLNLSL